MPVIEPPRLAPTRRDRLVVLALQVTATLVVAALAHLSSILLLPRRAEHDAYARVLALVRTTPLKTVAAPPAADRTFPYRDPATATTFCLYDLRVAPVRVSIDVAGADFVAVSFHSRRGVTFYGLTSRSASNGTVAVTLVTPQQFTEAEAGDSSDEPFKDLRVAAPEPEGFVEVDALATAPSARPGAEAAAQKLVCSAAKSP